MNYKTGLNDGIAIGLGYFSVSFTFGMIATSMNISPLEAVALSACNLTSAGQFAAISLINSNASILEVILTTILINFRYIFMSISLSQHLQEKITLPQKMMLSFGNTDEVYALSTTKNEKLSFHYMMGLITLPFIGWTSGTFLGATFNSLLPPTIQSAFGIALYAMFIAIIIPAAKSNKPIFLTIILASILSVLFKYMPLLKTISSGFSIIIITIISTSIIAILFPIQEVNND